MSQLGTLFLRVSGCAPTSPARERRSSRSRRHTNLGDAPARRLLHAADLAAGFGAAPLPCALATIRPSISQRLSAESPASLVFRTFLSTSAGESRASISWPSVCPCQICPARMRWAISSGVLPPYFLDSLAAFTGLARHDKDFVLELIRRL